MSAFALGSDIEVAIMSRSNSKVLCYHVISSKHVTRWKCVPALDESAALPLHKASTYTAVCNLPLTLITDQSIINAAPGGWKPCGILAWRNRILAKWGNTPPHKSAEAMSPAHGGRHQLG